jgi:hypothetical protein
LRGSTSIEIETRAPSPVDREEPAASAPDQTLM